MRLTYYIEGKHKQPVELGASLKHLWLDTKHNEQYSNYVNQTASGQISSISYCSSKNKSNFHDI